jgi:hypothetical protein
MSVPINNVTRRVVYAASGTGPYNFSFEILAATDIAVYRDDTLLTLTTDYTVTINANGTGSVTLTATPTGATQIAIVGNRTIQRLSDFVTGGDFFANTLNDELDQQTIFAQQNAEGLGRALSAPQTDPTTINMTLPRAADRANKTLNFDVNGNPVAGLAVVATATGAVATWMGVPSSANLAAAMTDETGTGALVFATSPTLTTPTINGATVAGNITITGTARRITGDFSNATLASRVMFQTSTTNGATVVSALPNGTSTDAALVVYNGNDPANSASGSMYANAADVRIAADKVGTGTYLPMTFYTNGSERVRVDTSGRVGIGTSSPGQKLSVTGNIAAGDTSSTADGFVDITGDNTGSVRITRTGTGATDSSMVFSTTFSTLQERMRITSSGNVGIGTNIPAHTLDVNVASASFRVRNASGGNDFTVKSVAGPITQIGSVANTSLEILTNDLARIHVTAAGNVGIGNTPSVKLDVQGAGTIRGFLTTTDAIKLGANTSAPTTTDAFVYRPADNTLAFGTASTEQARINAAGELLIGTTTDNGAYLLQVNSQIWATNATIATSDARLKENVAPINGALDTIKVLQPVTFDFKQGTGYNFDDERQTGFIAQDLQAALAGQDYVDCVVKECGPYLGVAYEKLIPVLTKAIQEQQAIIEQLTQRIAALEGA